MSTVPQKIPDVVLVPCSSYEEPEVTRALHEALETAGGLGWVRPGMKIAVKANLVAAMKPDSAAVTHPALLAALTRELTARGAEVTVGDSPGGTWNALALSRVYQAAGMSAVEEAGGRLNRDFSEKDCTIDGAVSASSVHYTGWLDEADAIINFAKLKTHGMMGLSAAVKNMFGVIPGTMKPEYHMLYPSPIRFAHMLLDLHLRFPARLTLIDAVVGMEGNGPTAGKPRRIGCLLAGTDPSKLDMAAAKLIGLEPKQVPTLAAAMERGMISETADDLCFSRPIGEFLITDYKNIPNVNHLLEQNGNAALWGNWMDGFLRRFLATKPVPDSSCVGCGKCAKLCPARAITIENKRPSIDRKKCIRCFCCQEFCPVGAMKAKRPPLARLAGKL